MKFPGIKIQLPDTKALLAFLGFYLMSSIVYYTATWINYGGFQGGHPPYFNIVEYLSASGFQFLYSLLVTVPIWYLVVQKIYPLSVLWAYLSHFIFLPLFTLAVFGLLASTKSYFGWVFLWGGKANVWTFYLIAVFYVLQFVVIHAYQYHKAHQVAMEQQAELREMALQSQVIALKAQLNPHFLHNLFNSINMTIPPDQERTREVIIKLSDLFRYQNRASQQDLVTLREELSFIRNYLELTKLRLKERLEFQILIDDELLDSTIPPMILQPLVENAITHGIGPKIGSGTLTISVTKSLEHLTFEILDTGVGMAHIADYWNQGLGLTNTKKRLKQLYNSELLVLPNSPTGTRISFNI